MIVIKIKDKEKLNVWLLSYGFNQTSHEEGYLYLNFNEKSLKWNPTYDFNYPLVNPDYDVLDFRNILNNGYIINGDKLVSIQDKHIYVETKNGQKAIAKIQYVKDGKIYRYESYFSSTDLVYNDDINPVLVYTKDVEYIRLATEEEISKFNKRIAIGNFKEGDIIYIEIGGQTFISKYKRYNGILFTYFNYCLNVNEVYNDPMYPLYRIDDIDKIRLADSIEIETLNVRLLKDSYLIENNSLVKIKDGDYIHLTTKSGVAFTSKFKEIAINGRIMTYYDYSNTLYFYDNRTSNNYVTSVNNVKSIRFATKKEIENLESNIKPTELTLEEIAEKFGIDVKQLKIKK